MSDNKRVRGFSMVETLIVVAIVGVVSLAIASMITDMQKQTRVLNEKLAQMESLRLLTAAFGQAKICKAALTQPSAFAFNSTTLPATGGLPSGSVPMGSGTPGMQVGMPASPIAPTLIVSSLDLVNIQNAGSPDLWSGDIQVGFDQTKLVMPLRPLTARILFNTDPLSPATSKTVTDCAPDNFAASSLTQNGYVTFGNGLIMQWGVATANANSVTSVNFTIPFTTQVFSVVVTGTSDTGANAKDNWPTLYNHPGSTTLNNFNVFSANDSSDPVSWWAVGK